MSRYDARPSRKVPRMLNRPPSSAPLMVPAPLTSATSSSAAADDSDRTPRPAAADRRGTARIARCIALCWALLGRHGWGGGGGCAEAGGRRQGQGIDWFERGLRIFVMWRRGGGWRPRPPPSRAAALALDSGQNNKKVGTADLDYFARQKSRTLEEFIKNGSIRQYSSPPRVYFWRARPLAPTMQPPITPQHPAPSTPHPHTPRPPSNSNSKRSSRPRFRFRAKAAPARAHPQCHFVGLFPVERSPRRKTPRIGALQELRLRLPRRCRTPTSDRCLPKSELAAPRPIFKGRSSDRAGVGEAQVSPSVDESGRGRGTANAAASASAPGPGHAVASDEENGDEDGGE